MKKIKNTKKKNLNFKDRKKRLKKRVSQFFLGCKENATLRRHVMFVLHQVGKENEGNK